MFEIAVPLIVFISVLPRINTQVSSICNTLNDLKNNETDESYSSLKLKRLHILCNAIHTPRTVTYKEDTSLIPDFDLTQIDSEYDANQILKRFRRGRGGGGGGGRGGGGGGRSGGGRFSGGSRSSSSRSGGSRIFSGSSSSSSRGGIFSRSGTSGSNSYRVRSSLRSMIHKPSSSSSSRIASTIRSSSATGGSKPGIRDTIRKITGSTGSGFRSGGSRFGIGGSGGDVWVRSSKKFLPPAARFGKRYYQRTTYMRTLPVGTGYHTGSRVHYYPIYYGHGHYYGYPPVEKEPPKHINGTPPTVFYCIQEDLNTTLVNKTLNKDGFGVCNVSGNLVTCPVEIECKMSEADICCEDEQGMPYCCGGPIPQEYFSQYGGYADDWKDSAENFNTILHFITMMMIMMTTFCFTMWQRRGQ
ncbi:unnamed protein product [Adineta steineri]|uniref:Uncharacterized protein n=1 Tax=Adineta steineri TaxID=433720 RepID=A0A819B1G3_9BILA|nr:unnamed protein product [Adineta steineri]